MPLYRKKPPKTRRPSRNGAFLELTSMLAGCSDSAMFARVACSRGLVLQAGLLQLQTLQHALVSRFQTAEVLLRGYKHGIDQLIGGANHRDQPILLAQR